MGNLIADDGRGRQFTYNAMGRMAEVRQGASVLRRYAYNAWGEQVSKTDGTEAGTTLTLYDEAGHWLGDYDANGQSAQQAIWLDDYPVGLMQAGHTYYLETDHLGTPRVAIDPARDVAVWRWDLKGEAFGSTAPDEDPDRDGAAFVLDMRFPGQRYDSATGLYYNHQRDYDFGLGRYVQSDPLGLRAGWTTYGYVFNNPLIWVDSHGLAGSYGGATASFDYIRAVGLLNTWRARRDAGTASEVAEEAGLTGLHNGPGDAFRHCVWSCLMTQHIGHDNAKVIGDLHENHGDQQGQPKRERAMDEINNSIGRQCGMLSNNQNCQARCMSALRDGRLQTYPLY